MVPLGPRHDDFDLLSDPCIKPDGAGELAEATENCWQAILDQDRFGHAVHCSFDAQIAMFPRMVTPTVLELIDCYRDVALGWKLSGAAGYLVLVAERPVENAVRRYARRALGWCLGPSSGKCCEPASLR